MTEQTQTIAVPERKIFRAAILTAYLTENLKDESDLKLQKELYGYDPNNLNGAKFLKTKKGMIVSLDSPQYRESMLRRDMSNSRMVDLSNLVITGSTEDCEGEVRNMVARNPGLIVARYSIFYGGPSEYTGRLPEDAGYSLDIPKSVPAVRAMLTHERTLNAILSRDETRIRKALDCLNSKLENPILITPHLTKALSAGVSER